MAAVLCLGRRSHDRGRQIGVLPQAVGEVIPVDRASPVGVLSPQRGAGDAGDVATHDHFDRQRLGGAGDENVGVGKIDDVIGDDIGSAFEPPSAELIEHLTLVRDPGDHPVECRQAIGRDEQALAAAVCVRDTHLSVPAIAERQVDVEERVVPCLIAPWRSERPARTASARAPRVHRG